MRIAHRLAGISLLLIIALTVQAQLSTGTVTGKVVAPDGEPAVGARVTLKSVSTSRQCSVETDDNGEYICTGLRPGTYKITVAYKQFKGTVEEAQVQGGLYGNPSAPEFRNRFDLDLGRVVGQQPEVSEEQKEFEKAKAGFERAVALNQAGKYREAIEELQPVVEHDPSQWVAHAQLAVAYAGLGRIDEAIQAYLSAIELNPTQPDLYNNLGELYVKQGQLQKAREQFQMASELSAEKGPRYYYNLAVTYYNSRNLRAAIEPLKKVIELEPNHANAHFFLGVCLYSTAQTRIEDGEVKTVLPPGTREHFQRYLELQPEGPHAEDARQYLEIIEASVTSGGGSQQ